MLPDFSDEASFTLIELLIVIAILAILATAVILVINPTELLKQNRDSQRLNDLSTINSALSLLQSECYSCSFGSSSAVYVSIPDTSPTCANLGLPTLPSGWTYACVTQTNLQKVNGLGWIPVDFTKFSAGPPLAKLPIDPVNTTSTGEYYAYVAGGSWELTAFLESAKYKMGGDNDKTSNDGGSYPELLEIGTNLSLQPVSRDPALVGYWKFDEGNGTSTYDASGNNNNGTLFNGPTWTTGKVGGALSFDGVNDYVGIPVSSSLNGLFTELTVVAWVKALGGDGNWRSVVEFGGGGAIRAHFYYSYIQRMYANWINESGASQGLDGQNALQLGNWYHFAWIYDGVKGKMYLNGTIDGQRSVSGKLDTTLGTYIGMRQGSSLPFNGLIDEVRIYNRALSAAEIQAIYNATK